MNDVSVIAYFADDPTRTYQLVQWLPVLDLLDETHRVGIVVRDRDAATELRARTTLPVFEAPSFPELTALHAELDAKVVLYCNNSMLNFQSLIDGRMLRQGMLLPRDLIGTALFLAGDASRRVTGHTIAVDDGYLAA